MADTGWLTATAARSLDIGLGPWYSPTNVYLSDDLRAYCVGGASAGDRLNSYTYGANISAGATIVGIEVKVERKGGAADKVQDESVYLMSDTTTKGNNKADTVNYWPTTDTDKIYGGSSDLWGASWTATQINAATFGAGIQIAADPYGQYAYVDCIQIKIYYSIPSSIDHLMMMGM